MKGEAMSGESERILVCGGRDFTDRELLFEVMDRQRSVALVIQGCARGADTLAGEWADSRSVPVLKFPADWKKHGYSAGPIRNKRMLAEGKPDCVIAFPGGRGTADMVRRAKAAGVPVYQVEDK